MKLRENFEVIEIAGEYMAIPTGSNMASYGGSVVLNDVSAFLLKKMKKPISKEELLKCLLKEYEVDCETAMADLDEILTSLNEIGLIEQ